MTSTDNPHRWIDSLSEYEVRNLAAELVSATTVPAATMDDLRTLIMQWRHTAEVYVDPEVHAALTGPIGNFGPTPEPIADTEG